MRVFVLETLFWFWWPGYFLLSNNYVWLDPHKPKFWVLAVQNVAFEDITTHGCINEDVSEFTKNRTRETCVSEMNRRWNRDGSDWPKAWVWKITPLTYILEPIWVCSWTYNLWSYFFFWDQFLFVTLKVEIGLWESITMKLLHCVVSVR